MSHEVNWLDEPEPHDYPAAFSYLTLVFDEKKAGALVRLMRNSKVTKFKAKDIFRASGLPLLGLSNAHVEHNREKIKTGKPLSPILLVRHTPLIICDGYHRVCAVYGYDEDAWIPCKIAGEHL